MEEKSCPICKKHIRSDAEVHEYCVLCGMGITDIQNAPLFEKSDSKILYFCCNRCLTIYESEIA